MNYSSSQTLNIPFSDAVAKVKSLLPAEGFGVLTEIDVKATLKKKLDVDFQEYVILGICNPPFAHKALLTEKEVGLFMPCNIIVYEEAGKVIISAMLPTAALNALENPTLSGIAAEAELKIKRVINNLEGR